jgi:hypothetical protein
VLALAGRNHDRVGTDVRPRQAQQIAEPQPGMRCKIDGVGSRAIRPSPDMSLRRTAMARGLTWMASAAAAAPAAWQSSPPTFAPRPW